MAVNNNYESKTVGSYLIKAALEHAKKHKIKLLKTKISEFDHLAVALFKTAEFESAGREDNAFYCGLMKLKWLSFIRKI